MISDGGLLISDWFRRARGSWRGFAIRANQCYNKSFKAPIANRRQHCDRISDRNNGNRRHCKDAQKNSGNFSGKKQTFNLIVTRKASHHKYHDMKRLRLSATITAILGFFSILALIFLFMALSDIADSITTHKLEWYVAGSCLIVIGAFTISTFITLANFLKSSDKLIKLTTDPEWIKKK